MSQKALFQLLSLAALWGSSFLFMRVAAPEFGPVALASFRVVGAALFLTPLLWQRRLFGEVRQHAPALFAAGLTGSALPFTFYAYASLSLPAGLSAVFNAATPLFGALVAWVWLRERLNRWRSIGLAVGFAGVLGLAVSKVAPQAGMEAPAWAVLACLASTLLYGVGAGIVQRYLQGVSPLTIAGGSQLGAAVIMLPLGLWQAPAQMPSMGAWGAAVGLAVACTGLAYILFFQLVSSVGSARAMTVTYLVPLFAVVWGWLFLDEAITPPMLMGGGVILLGTALATGYWRPTRPGTQNERPRQ
jgi:drug/metabolite transporter (DMT)-like permease